MLEKSVEDYLKAAVEKRGGLCVKLNPSGYKGIPDRLVLLPGGVPRSVEVKRPRGGRVAGLQLLWQAKLLELGFASVILKSREEVDELLASAGRVDQDDQLSG